MKSMFNLFFITYIAVGSISLYSLWNERTANVITTSKAIQMPTVIEKQAVVITQPPVSYVIPQSHFVSQSFNNCGPASLSMVMSMLGKEVSQEELGGKMRPYQIPNGDNDDKSVFADEFVAYANEYGFASLHRPNGTINLLKKLTANGIPVVVRTWLNPQEDIGHFRIVRGYDEDRKVIIQDDSYQGANLEYEYETFLEMWQPFNYGYIVVYPKEKDAIVKTILGSDVDEEAAWTHAKDRALQELRSHPDSVYAKFNLSTAYYYLKDYNSSVREYEEAAAALPLRMLWYQIEPMQAYYELGNREAVFTLTDAILENNNRAFSELYLMRGNMYAKEGNREEAREEFEKAVYYNQNLRTAKDALDKI